MKKGIISTMLGLTQNCGRLLRLSSPLYMHPARYASAQASSAIVVRREVDFSRWYLDVVAAADLIDSGPVKGQVILKPNGYAIWEAIRTELDTRIRAAGAVNAYFPLLLPVSFFSREAAHVEGFAKECAVVTHHRLRVASKPALDGSSNQSAHLEPDPTAELGEPLVIRPTSETVIWDAFSRWIKSHRDLPLVLNQWANVVRWEMRTRPFLRTSEFLWQEGHTAHASESEALLLAGRMQDMYAELCETVLAMPVIKGPKSASERFAGADATLTCEAMMPNGWALQSATSHFLGRNFARAFDVRYTAATGEREYVWATSWGASTRLIGGTIMAHSDDVGLVLPPAVAPVQVVVVLIPGGTADAKAAVLAAGEALRAQLSSAGLRVAVDSEVGSSLGSRLYHWERRGVPLRLEVGPRDVQAGVAILKDRLGGPKVQVPLPSVTNGAAPLAAAVKDALASVHARLLAAARARLEANIHPITSYKSLRDHAAAVTASGRGGVPEEDEQGANAPKTGEVAPAGGAAPKGGPASSSSVYSPPWRMFLAPWRDDPEAEAAVKAETKYTIRCFPTAEQGRLVPGGAGATPGEDVFIDPGVGPSGGIMSPATPDGGDWGACFYSGKPATHVALFARAF